MRVTSVSGFRWTRARCIVAEAEIALVSRDLSWPRTETARGVLQEWELEARLMDVAIDEGMTSKGDDGSNKVAAKSLLPEVKKAQQDLGAKPIPDDGAPTRFTP
jgi:hypothetical protein